MNPVISVILPYYNAENTLQKAIGSILYQTFKDFELLLIDNNSTDKSCSITQKIANKDFRIRLLKEKKQGVANAMNCGLKNSVGEYVSRMDADDFAHPEKLSKQIKFLKKIP